MAKTRAQENKAIRQQALREQLAAQGHVQHVVDITLFLADLGKPLDSVEVQRLRAACDNHWKAIDKYLPSLKPVDGNESSADVLTVNKVVREIVKPAYQNG